MARRISIITSSLDGEKPDMVDGQPFTTLEFIKILVVRDYRFNTDSTGMLVGGRIIRKAKKAEKCRAEYLDLETEDWKLLKEVVAKPQAITTQGGTIPIGYGVSPSYLCVDHIDAINEAKDIREEAA